MTLINNPRLALTEEERDILFKASLILTNIYVIDSKSFSLDDPDRDVQISDMDCSLASSTCAVLSGCKEWHLVK